jgi:hypothetical protein
MILIYKVYLKIVIWEKEIDVVGRIKMIVVKFIQFLKNVIKLKQLVVK